MKVGENTNLLNKKKNANNLCRYPPPEEGKHKLLPLLLPI